MFIKLSEDEILNLTEVRRMRRTGNIIKWWYKRHEDEPSDFTCENEDAAKVLFKKICNQLLIMELP